MRRPYITESPYADALVRRRDRKKTVESLYLSISDADLLSGIDRIYLIRD